MPTKCQPGEVRDAIVAFLRYRYTDATLSEIVASVQGRLSGRAAESSIRSYLNQNTPPLFERTGPGRYRLQRLASDALSLSSDLETTSRVATSYGRAKLYCSDCFAWLAAREAETVHGVVTDPPYGLVEYCQTHKEKLRNGKGGVWRIPPSYDGNKRSPVPRFTTLAAQDIDRLVRFFIEWGKLVHRVLVPGGHVIVASQPLVSYAVGWAMVQAGFERRGEIIRLVTTLRGGDRPKNAHDEFPEVSVMPRGMWEPWLLFRKPLDGTVRDNLRRWKTGGLRRPSAENPFGDVVKSSPTQPGERKLAPHPTLKPQAFLRPLVRAVLPLGEGVVIDPFAGSGSTLAAAESVGYESLGVEADHEYVDMAAHAIPKLAELKIQSSFAL